MRGLVLLVPVVLGACAEPEPARPTVEVRARFERALFDGQAATVEHEVVPGVMPAMRMDLRVADPALLDGLAPGDPVRLTLDSASLGVVDVERLPEGTVLDLPDDPPGIVLPDASGG